VCFGRTPPDSNVDFHDLDLSQAREIEIAVRKAYADSPPQGAVFCQRYRPATGISELEALLQGLVVELAPLFSLVEVIESGPKPSPLRSLVLLSSVAGRESHPDIPIHYQILKAATLATVRSLTARLAPIGIRINCLVLGEFLKGPRSSYPEYKLRHFSEIEKFTVDGRICGLGDIFHAVRFLLSKDAAVITGQELTLDSGLSLLGAEALLRQVVTPNDEHTRPLNCFRD